MTHIIGHTYDQTTTLLPFTNFAAIYIGQEIVRHFSWLWSSNSGLITLIHTLGFFNQSFPPCQRLSLHNHILRWINLFLRYEENSILSLSFAFSMFILYLSRQIFALFCIVYVLKIKKYFFFILNEWISILRLCLKIFWE